MEYYEFVETSVFTREMKTLLSDDEYKEFQTFLIENPEAGDLIVGTGGCRKVRWSRQGTGKSSGVRAIYYFYNPAGRLYMLIIYPKSEKDSLTAAEKNQLKAVVAGFKVEEG
ncbi:TPA: type II toxin-antitoxin system RelE/ParE family toxin [Klebsiella variicola subsp. variicola]